jgi:CheY-like chemotaxis protein
MNGREALYACCLQQFDVVLMDVQMPLMDGLFGDLGNPGARSGSKERVPIIGLTAHAMKADAVRCLEPVWTATSQSPSKPKN